LLFKKSTESAFSAYLKENSLRVFSIPADGHCLINSIRLAIGQINLNDKVNNVYYLYRMCENEISCNSHRYLNFNSSHAFYRGDSLLSLYKDLENYFFERQWNTEFGDLLVDILANALKINIIVFNIENDSAFKILEFGRTFNHKIRITLNENHYDAILNE
jgi:hypothetical protein